MSDKLLFSTSDWTMEKIEKTWEVIDRIAKEKYGLEYPKPQIEIVTSRQMLHYHSLNGLPFFYDHWSAGKSYVAAHDDYQEGKSSLAYETIINTDPTICYIMETNSMTMQALVMAHAVVGHGSMFKLNECFKAWTNPESVLSYAKFAKKFVEDCEQKYGIARVEHILDAAHALSNLGIDKYERIRLKRDGELKKLDLERRLYMEKIYNEVWSTLPKKKNSTAERPVMDFPWPFPEENVLYFIEKNSPSLEEWERELIHIVRYFAQYYYPQMQCKLMHEGWASFWHYTIMNDLFEEGYINEGSMLEFLDSHAAVCSDWTGTDPEKGPAIEGFNPYNLGFKMFMKIKQACENPTELDKIEFPGIAGSNWIETFKDIAANYVDSSFVGQFLSSETAEELGIFSGRFVKEKETEGMHPLYRFLGPLWKFHVEEIQDRDKLKTIRRILSERYSIANLYPTIEVVGCDMKSDRRLSLKHIPFEGQALGENQAKASLKYLNRLWTYPISLETIDDTGAPYTRQRNFIK